MKKHAHIYKNSQASHAAFKNFGAALGYQRSDSGLWYASHEEAHHFFSATDPSKKLLSVDWDTMNIAQDVTPQDKAAILSACRYAGYESSNATQFHQANPSASRFQPGNAFILKVRGVRLNLLRHGWIQPLV